MKKTSHPKFARISEEMQQWSALLASELQGWPAVTSRRMFGMTVLYRQGVIFAALPRTKSFATPRAVAFKLYRMTPALRRSLESDTRISLPSRENGRWISFEIGRESDLTGALAWFGRAYRAARK